MHHPTRPIRRAVVAVVVALAALLATMAPAAAAPKQPKGPNWAELEKRLEPLVAEAAAAGITMSVTVKDLSGSYNGAVAGAGESERVKAASVIKLPLLAALMDRVDEGTLSLDSTVTIQPGDPNIVGGSGTLRFRTFPQTLTIAELMELMVIVSDNTASNVLIDVAGGFATINAYTEGLGLQDFYFGRKFIFPSVPPLQENYISANDVTELLRMIWTGEILSRPSSDFIIGLMEAQLVNTKYGAVIPRAVLANKTGELGDASHDSGFITIEGREVALATTTAFGPPLNRQRDVDPYVQRSAQIVYEFLQEALPGANGNRPPQSYKANR